MIFAFLIAAAKPTLTAILLRWTAVPHAVGYEIELATDDSFTEPILHERTDTTTYRWEALPEKRVFWHVRSIDSEGRFGEWSESKELAPVFVAPEPKKAPGKIALGESARLEWSASRIFCSYRIEIASDKAFSRRALNRSLSDPFFVWQPGETGIFYWRVYGADAGGHETEPSPAKVLIVSPHPAALMPLVEPPRKARKEPLPLWTRHFWLSPTLALGGNLRSIFIYSLGLEAGYVASVGAEQLGVTIATGFYYAAQTTAASNLVLRTQLYVFPTTVLATVTRPLGDWRLRLGVGIALDGSVATVAATGIATVTDDRLSPGFAANAAVDWAVGPGAILGEIRFTYATSTGAVRFETGGLVAVIGYAFYL